ncbi:galactoside 2-alpha-L-fucosyltransferase 2-like [Thamnophis elegans]|uniref:galactoside 2-alpha-L-fucosyltransferase 2-like n=1 Tax=Thamnophis elegans TaxID=35005 RepID=UPI001377B2E2|nr:galactoside 2-alpha-L-fucosyltransferase 2-like [Thamnophis elegans]
MIEECWGKRILSFVTIKHQGRGTSGQFSLLYFFYILEFFALSVIFHLPGKISHYYSSSKNTINSLIEQILFQNIIPNSSLSSEAIEAGIWTVNSQGRLGNQMGQYATLYALAKLNGYQACIHPEMHSALSPVFKITLPVISAKVFRKIQWRNVHLHDWMSEDYRHIQGKYVQLTGYPCSYTFYHHIRQEILKQFTFHDHIKEEANHYLQLLRGERQNVTYVGVHVRRGDYVRVMPKTWKGVVADKGYLEKAMDYFRKKYLNPIFVVTSNGMEWCKKNINASRGDVYFAGDGKEASPGRDFAFLTHCNHTIMTIGTFGIWAAYLAGGEAVYLANYTLPDSPFLKVFKPSAAFLPEWIAIPANLSLLLPK